jgi:excisionase family DNA binding protein
MAGRKATKTQCDALARSPGHILAPKWDHRDTFSVEEAGEILGISRCSAYAAVKSGDLPGFWVGRRFIVPRRALERMLDPPAAIVPAPSCRRGRHRNRVQTDNLAAAESAVAS